MKVKQWEDKHLSHFSYAVLSDCEKKIILIDPARDPQPYLDFAKTHEATITGIIETHPHADFVSSHLEWQQTGAAIYASRLTNATYQHIPFDEGDEIVIGRIRLYPLNTPGHSPDSISIVMDHKGEQYAVFTGDTLFIGDCGRPDLRADDGDAKKASQQLARQMYHSLRSKLAQLHDDVIVYPAHGAGTLCGKALSEAHSSTMKKEKQTNWSLQSMSEDAFVAELLKDQPFIPAYFPFDVKLNKKGAPAFEESVANVHSMPMQAAADAAALDRALWIVDTRAAADYKKGHLQHAVNIMEGNKFETWLGSIIKPGESFYLSAADEKTLQQMIERTAAIGYETQVRKAFVNGYTEKTEPVLDLQHFKDHTSLYTIIDVRNETEVKEKKIFAGSIAIPLGELRNRMAEIPLHQPIVVHCAGGYRSAAGSSLIQSAMDNNIKVYDLGEDIKQFL